MWERGRREEAPQQEPKTFQYFRQAAGMIDYFQDANKRAQFENILSEDTSTNHVGPGIVEQFGVDISRQVATCVGVLAQQALANDGTDRIAKSAARWARKANDRIKDHGWEDPIPWQPEPQWGGYRSSRVWFDDWK